MLSAGNAGAAVWARWGADPSAKMLPEPVRLPSPTPESGEHSVVTIQVDAATSKLVERYMIVCKGLQVTPCPGVLTFIRLRLSELRPEKWNNGPSETTFGDSDMYAFCDWVLREKAPCAIFEHWSHFDGQHCRIGGTGCQMLARVLGLQAACVHTVDLRNQQIGTRGTRALVEAIRLNHRLVHVGLYGSFIEDAGAKLVAEMLREGGEGARTLETLDLSVNMLSFPICRELQLAAPSEVKLVLKGNRVLDEVLNASSHAVGVLLVILGAIFLAIAVADHPEHGLGPDGTALSNSGYVASVVIYLVSLFCLYLASTLYHSMFAMGGERRRLLSLAARPHADTLAHSTGPARRPPYPSPTHRLSDAVLDIFAIFDQSAIYLLIAGSYTPFLTILFPDRPLYSVWLLGFMWFMAIGGIVLHLTYYGPFKTGLQVKRH